MPKFERLSGWDYATWFSASEDPVMRSTMIGCLVLQESPDWERLVDRYDRASRVGPIPVSYTHLTLPTGDLV